MIATLEGKVTEKHINLVTVQVSGVGFGVYVNFEDFGAIKEGEIAKLFIHESIRENAHDLFGFRNRASKVLFEQLLTVKGVGPRMALSILSVASLEQVRRA